MAIVTSTQKLKHDPRMLGNCLFERAKNWWIASLTCKVASIVVGAANVLVFPNVKFGAVAVFLIYAAAEISAWRSETFKGMAEAVKRKTDFSDSFGWEISGLEMADLVMDCPAKLRKKITAESADKYFDSIESAGATRAIENLQQSSWYSRRVFRLMGHIGLGLTITLVLTSIIVLLISIDTVRDYETLSSVGRVVTSVLMLIFSLGLVRLTMAYYSFSKKASQSEQNTIKLFAAGCNELEAVKAWHEYQVARTASPLVPLWIWERMKEGLNEAWEQYRRRQPDHCVDDESSTSA